MCTLATVFGSRNDEITAQITLKMDGALIT